MSGSEDDGTQMREYSFVESEPAELKTPSGTKRDDDYCQFNFRLIREVKKRPVLYDTTHMEYQNFSYRYEQWIEIAALLHSTPEFAKGRWKTLRDRFKKEARKAEMKGPGGKSQWQFMSSLEFIRDHFNRVVKTVPMMERYLISECAIARDSKCAMIAGRKCAHVIQIHSPLGAFVLSDDLRFYYKRPMTDVEDFQYNAKSMKTVIETLALGIMPENECKLEERDVEEETESVSCTPSTSRDVVLGMTSDRTLGIEMEAQKEKETEEDFFGRMIAARLSKMTPDHRDKAKIRVLTALYSLEPS